MNILLDTHLLLWVSLNDPKLPRTAREAIEDQDNTIYFSTVSLWEVSIKLRLGRPDFTVDPRLLRRGLLDQEYRELSVDGPHAVTVVDLPLLHKDPFDRLLIAQATAEGITLMTADKVVAQYPGPIRLV